MHQLNEEIRDKELRLIGSGGEQLGIMSASEALRIAEEKGLDLVKISPQANPPVCKLMDYGKYRFEQGKREKEARKNQHIVEIKEIRMSPGIAEVPVRGQPGEGLRPFSRPRDGPYRPREEAPGSVCRAVRRRR